MGDSGQKPWKQFLDELILKAMKDETFRSRLIANPKSVLDEELARVDTGIKLPGDTEVKVLEQAHNELFIILPEPNARKEGSELSDRQLESVAGGLHHGEMTYSLGPDDGTSCMC